MELLKQTRRCVPSVIEVSRNKGAVKKSVLAGAGGLKVAHYRAGPGAVKELDVTQQCLLCCPHADYILGPRLSRSCSDSSCQRRRIYC